MNFSETILIGLALMIGSLILVTGWERRRVRRLKEAAAALGLRACQQGEPLALPSVELLRKRGRMIGTSLEGIWRGETVTIFDLSCPAGKSSSHTTVFMLRLREPCIPEFAAIRKNFWLYLPRVDLPRLAHPPDALRHGWYVYAPEERWLLSDKATRSLGHLEQWSIEGSGSGLYLFHRGKRTPVRNLERWLDAALMAAQEVTRCLPNTPFTEKFEGTPQHSIRQRVFAFKTSWRI